MLVVLLYLGGYLLVELDNVDLVDGDRSSKNINLSEMFQLLNIFFGKDLYYWLWFISEHFDAQNFAFVNSMIFFF